MLQNSLLENLVYAENKPAITVLLETENTKEIRIVMQKGQHMKAHKTPFPIVVEIFEGEIEFGVEGEKHLLSRGKILSLAGNLVHDLSATQNSIVRLSLAKADDANRVKTVAQNS